MSFVDLSALDKGKSKMTALEELNRPLEEHWAVDFKYTLDPKKSDYNYKHHITHLEEIYQNHKFLIKEPPRKLIKSPVAQLYGVDGIRSNRPLQKSVEKSRESKWVENFQKYHYLDDKLTDETKQRVKDKKKYLPPNTNDISRRRRNNIQETRAKAELETDDEEIQPKNFHFSRKSNSEELSSTDLIMFGMYRLNPEQEEIYQKFVNMLAQFNQFDMESIVEDALNEAATKDIDMDDYAGTMIEDV